MDFQTLRILRDRLRDDAAIQAFAEAYYPASTISFFIGLKPDVARGLGIPADRFPYLAISPLQENQETRPSKNLGDRVSIMFGVNDDLETDGVFQGIERIVELSALVLRALESQPLSITPSVVWDGQAQTIFDAGTQHPYYEAEIILNLEVRHER